MAGGYLKRAGAPGPFVGTDIAPLWYSYDHGPIHFLVYSTELDFYPGSPQYKCAPTDTSHQIYCKKLFENSELILVWTATLSQLLRLECNVVRIVNVPN